MERKMDVRTKNNNLVKKIHRQIVPASCLEIGVYSGKILGPCDMYCTDTVLSSMVQCFLHAKMLSL